MLMVRQRLSHEMSIVVLFVSTAQAVAFFLLQPHWFAGLRRSAADVKQEGELFIEVYVPASTAPARDLFDSEWQEIVNGVQACVTA